jgi:NADH-quinone oxidoreductase subunit N
MPANFMPPVGDYFQILPEILLTFFGIVVMMLEAVTRGKRGYLGVISLVGIALALASNVPGLVASFIPGIEPIHQGSIFHGMLSIDGYGVFFRAVVLGVGFLSILASLSYLAREVEEGGEFYALILFSLVGQCIMVTASDLIMVFIGLEISSIATYILAGFVRDDRRANESALKYFLLGSFATAFLLYGTAWIFGLVNSTNFEAIRRWIPLPENQGSSIMAVAVALIFVGLGFKVSIAPFQMWAPDVYQGAAAPASGFMSAGPKAAAFAVFFRLFMTSFMPIHDRWSTLVWGCALGTMFIGNLGALLQTNVKRLLGYSSIAHAGYVLVALASASTIGVTAAMFYLASYALMNIGAFAVIGYVASRNERFVRIEDLAGLGRREPATAALLSVFVFSLIGVPLTGGFFGKFYIFQAALSSHLVWLTILGLVNSAIAAYYYLKIIVAIYMQAPDVATMQLQPPPTSLRIAMWLSAAGVLILGLFPSTLLQFATSSAATLR